MPTQKTMFTPAKLRKYLPKKVSIEELRQSGDYCSEGVDHLVKVMKSEKTITVSRKNFLRAANHDVDVLVWVETILPPDFFRHFSARVIKKTDAAIDKNPNLREDLEDVKNWADLFFPKPRKKA